MQIYDLPGSEITALNMTPQTAKYKAMMTIYLANEVFKIKTEDRKKFITKMMISNWSNEFLPKLPFQQRVFSVE